MLATASRPTSCAARPRGIACFPPYPEGEWHAIICRVVRARRGARRRRAGVLRQLPNLPRLERIGNQQALLHRGVRRKRHRDERRSHWRHSAIEHEQEEGTPSGFPSGFDTGHPGWGSPTASPGTAGQFAQFPCGLRQEVATAGHSSQSSQPGAELLQLCWRVAVFVAAAHLIFS